MKFRQIFNIERLNNEPIGRLMVALIRSRHQIMPETLELLQENMADPDFCREDGFFSADYENGIYLNYVTRSWLVINPALKDVTEAAMPLSEREIGIICDIQKVIWYATQEEFESEKSKIKVIEQNGTKN